MATVSCRKVAPPPHGPIPPDGTLALSLGPDDSFRAGAITVTAQATGWEPVPSFSVYIEVVQTVTRIQPSTGLDGTQPGWYLDLVVRNNGHVGEPDVSTR